jgi:hypothetical protein
VAESRNLDLVLSAAGKMLMHQKLRKDFGESRAYDERTNTWDSSFGID